MWLSLPLTVLMVLVVQVSMQDTSDWQAPMPAASNAPAPGPSDCRCTFNATAK